MSKKIRILSAIILAVIIFMDTGFGSGILSKTVNVSGAQKVSSKNDATTVTGKTLKISKKTRATKEEMISGYNNYALKSLKEAVKGEEKGTNVMISPASLMFALDMAAAGANGKTYKQMANLFRKNATKKDLLSFAKDYRKSLEKSGIMSIANSIWINETNLKNNNIKVNEQYLNLVRKYFKAAAASRVFSDSVKEEINSWISDKTKGMIKNALDRLSDETLMLIINAMAFEGKWKEEYKDYQIDKNGKFRNYEGKTEKAKMLSSTEDIYLSSDTAKGFLKYYEGDKYAFMAMLPLDENISINDYVASLPDDALEQFYKSRYYQEVITKTPAFKFDYDINLNKMLMNMGMKKAFTSDADFLSMIDPDTVTPELSVYISSIIQKTHIELDEKGTKAAAVTIIAVDGCIESEPEQPKEVILDRPFVFAIMDTETGTPVFTGVVNSVK